MSVDRAVELRSYAIDARALAANEFAERHGVAFLVRSTASGQLQPPRPLAPEDWVRPTREVLSTGMMRPVGRAGSGPAGDTPSFFVYPVRKRHPSVANISVGRSPAADICIGDASLSKLHAEFEATGNGALVLIDKGSRNGTMLGEERIIPNVAYDVPFRWEIRFGRVRLSYMQVAPFMEFVRTMT